MGSGKGAFMEDAGKAARDLENKFPGRTVPGTLLRWIDCLDDPTEGVRAFALFLALYPEDRHAAASAALFKRAVAKMDERPGMMLSEAILITLRNTERAKGAN